MTAITRTATTWTAITRTAIIPAAPAAVWRVLADFGGISAWAPGVDHSCLLQHGEDPAAVGTTRRVQAGRTTLVERITDSTAPHTLGYDIEGLPQRLGRVANRWEVTPFGASSAVALTSTVQAGGGPIGRITGRLVCRMLAGQSESMLAGLSRQAQQVEEPR